MSYVRTFFKRPLLDEFGGSPRSVAMIDFEDISVLESKAIGESDHKLCVRMVGGQELIFSDRSKVDFLEAFEEYARAMQSLERGPIGFFPDTASRAPAIDPPKITGPVVIRDPKKKNKK